MQIEQHDLWAPSNSEDGVQQLKSSLTSLDFYLLDDIDVYLSSVQPNTSKNDLINDSLIDNSQYPEELFPDFDFGDFNDFEEGSDFLVDSISTDDIDIEKWISQSSFPSPLTDASTSSPLNTDDPLSMLTSIADEGNANTDMIVPPSPSLSSTNLSSEPLRKKRKLSANERKLRKKDQNKSAAEKYRLRKKSERHQLLDQHSKLKTTNIQLKLELENLTDHVQQLKKLFSEVLQIEIPISN